jgi:hypothetical protein
MKRNKSNVTTEILQPITAIEKKTKKGRGRERIQPGYHASRGWFYDPIQKVIREWDSKLGREVTNYTFHQVRRVMEFGCGELVVEIKNAEHRQFVCELLTALNELHGRENSYGWVVKVWPQLSDTTRGRERLTYAEIKQKIIKQGGPGFSKDALKQAARRLRMLVSPEQRELDEQDVVNGR